MLAIPVFRARVAPVLNWCSRILVIPEDAEDSDEGHEILFEKTNIYELLQILKGIGVKTVICGALTPDLLNYGERLGVRMICGVAGHVAAVFQAFHAEKLHQPDFRLPGCGCRRKVRQSGGAAGVCEAAQERSEIMPNGRGQRGGGKGMGAGRKRGQGQGSLCSVEVSGMRSCSDEKVKNRKRGESDRGGFRESIRLKPFPGRMFDDRCLCDLS